MSKSKDKKLKSDLKAVEIQLENECQIHTEILRINQEEIEKLRSDLEAMHNKIHFYCTHICGVYRKQKTCLTCILREGLEE